MSAVMVSATSGCSVVTTSSPSRSGRTEAGGIRRGSGYRPAVTPCVRDLVVKAGGGFGRRRGRRGAGREGDDGSAPPSGGARIAGGAAILAAPAARGFRLQPTWAGTAGDGDVGVWVGRYGGGSGGNGLGGLVLGGGGTGRIGFVLIPPCEVYRRCSVRYGKDMKIFMLRMSRETKYRG